jgi:hypothetical protein
LTDAARALAAARSDEVPGGQAPTTPASPSARACAKKVVAGGVIGAGVGAGYVVVESADGTESAATALKAFAAVGFVLGALAGALTCTR